MNRASFFVVVLGMSPTGLYAVRELGKAGIDVYVADSERQTAGYSALLKSSSAWVAEPDNERLLEWLMQLARDEDRQAVLIATSDKYIEFIVDSAETLASSYSFQNSYKTGLYAEIVDKGRFAEKCKEHGVAHPNTWTLMGEQLANVADQIRFPCLIKPTLIHLVREYMSGHKVLIIRNKQEYLQKLRGLERLPVEWMIQEIIPGPESNITLFGGHFDHQYRLRQPFTCRKLRQYPAGFGSASLVRSELLEETRNESERFLRELGFQGIAGTEFKYDERDQSLKIIEINPRPTLWFGCASASGKSIVLDAVHDLMGLEPVSEREQRTDLIWRYAAKDVATQLFYRFNHRDFILPNEKGLLSGKVNTRVWAVFCREDPMPVWGELLNYFKKFVRRIYRKKHVS